MITIHHLRIGRSIFTVWLLEELGVPYEVKRYERDADTMLAPPELKAVHPLGKLATWSMRYWQRWVPSSMACVPHLAAHQYPQKKLVEHC